MTSSLTLQIKSKFGCFPGPHPAGEVDESVREVALVQGLVRPVQLGVRLLQQRRPPDRELEEREPFLRFSNYHSPWSLL